MGTCFCAALDVVPNPGKRVGASLNAADFFSWDLAAVPVVETERVSHRSLADGLRPQDMCSDHVLDLDRLSRKSLFADCGASGFISTLPVGSFFQILPLTKQKVGGSICPLEFPGGTWRYELASRLAMSGIVQDDQVCPNFQLPV